MTNGLNGTGARPADLTLAIPDKAKQQPDLPGLRPQQNHRRPEPRHPHFTEPRRLRGDAGADHRNDRHGLGKDSYLFFTPAISNSASTMARRFPPRR